MFENENGLNPQVEQPVPNTDPVLPVENPEKQNEVKVETQPQDDGKNPKTFTQEQVNLFVKKRLARNTKSFLENYEISGEDEFKELIGKAQSYEAMKLSKEEMTKELTGVRQTLWFKDNNVNPDRIDDIKAHFKGTESELTNESLVEALKTHPEWLNNLAEQNPVPKTTIQKLNPDKNTPPTKNDEDEMAKMFGLKSFIKK